MTQEIPLDQITIDPRTQLRDGDMKQSLVAEYADHMRRHVVFPDVIVFGDTNILADGHYRVAAANLAGCETINAEVYEGDIRDAIKFAAGANYNHGLPRTNADKKKAVRTLLLDAEWNQWSNADLARTANVATSFARKIRRQMIAAGEISEQDTILTTRDGKTVERKPTRAVDSETRKPKTQEEADFANFKECLNGMLFPYDGKDAADKWSDLVDDDCRLRIRNLAEWLTELEASL